MSARYCRTLYGEVRIQIRAGALDQNRAHRDAYERYGGLHASRSFSRAKSNSGYTL
jgi:hypothetical protein